MRSLVKYIGVFEKLLQYVSNVHACERTSVWKISNLNDKHSY